MSGEARSEGRGRNHDGWPTAYEIRIQGGLNGGAAAWFDGLQVRTDGSVTLISGLMVDQPALHGVLLTVRDLDLELISVRQLKNH
jgi:hypothetical protein